jgi:hypothetical protein
MTGGQVSIAWAVVLFVVGSGSYAAEDSPNDLRRANSPTYQDVQPASGPPARYC